jgi:hypothetical protein
VKPGQDAAIQILRIADGSDRPVEVKGWSNLVGIAWAADGKSLWAGGVGAKNSGSGGSGTYPLLRIGLDGKISVMSSVSDVCFFVGIPSPDGRNLALEGEKAPTSNVWLLENF